jgi:hypothetical protein
MIITERKRSTEYSTVRDNIPFKTVRIRVRGGIASCDELPQDVRVILVDHDNP